MANYTNNSGQIRLGWRSAVVTQVVNAVDADAQAFISAAGITDLTQASAISTLVDDLKTYGIWSKMKALYPFVGGSATSHKFNLKDPRDLDAAFRLVFNGGWSHASTGAKPNGTNGYADSKFIISQLYSNITNIHISYYSRTNTNKYEMIGMQDDNVGQGSQIYVQDNGTNQTYSALNTDPNTININNNIQSTIGHYLSSRTSLTLLKGYKNGVLQGSNTTTSSGLKSTLPIIIGGSVFKYNSTSYYSGNKESAFASIGDGLTDGESANFYTAVQKFQTTLGRQVGTPAVSDSDAQAFLNAAGITDLTQTSAVNTLVTDLKTAGVWTKMKVIYPFIGGNATSHKFNLKDPRDLDAAYRLQFNGGWTHNSNGVTPNGSNGFARTFFVDTNLSINSVSYSIYNRSNTPQNVIYSDFGYFRYNSSYVSNYFTTNYAPYGWGGRVSSWNSVSQTRTDYRGFYNGNRTNSTDFNFFLNGTKALTQNDNTSGKLQTGYQFHLGCLFIDGQYYSDWSTNNYAFAHISDGLTDIEAVSLHRAVQKYQTTLGRQIDIPLVSDEDAQAFLTAAGITSYTQANAVNTLVVDLKATGVWTKMKALYPFVGGSATSHKFNLKDPRDVDAAYRLVFTGGWTHTSTGALPNGTTGYADTFLNDFTNLTSGDNHISVYVNTNESNTSAPYTIGIYNPNSNSGLAIRTFGNSDSSARFYNNHYVNISNTISTSTGFWLNTAKSNRFIGFKNSSKIIDTTPSISAANGIISLSCVRWTDIGATQYSSQQQVFASIGDGLSETEAANFYTAVQKFQTALGRQVGTPVYNTNGLVLNLDAGNANSYPGTGTTWFDLASGNNGTMFSGITYDVNNGGGLIFNGSNQYISSFNNTNLNFTSSDKFTISCFFKATSTSSYLGLVVSGNTSGEWNYGLWVTNGKLQAGTHNNNRVGNSTIVTGQIYQATLTYSNNTMKVYLNGLNDGTFTSISLFNGLNQQLTIGRKGARAENYFPGTVYNVQIYNRELSETEVLQNFNNTRGRFGL